MPIDELRGIKVRMELGFEGFLRNFDFVSARTTRSGLFEVTIRPRYLLIFPGKPRTYCGTAYRWRNAKGKPPSTLEALYLCRCAFDLVVRGLRPEKRKTFENPLRM